MPVPLSEIHLASVFKEQKEKDSVSGVPCEHQLVVSLI